MKIFLICPVRNASEEQKSKMEQYISGLEGLGHEVYYPARDTDQEDSVGYRICSDNTDAIWEADEVHMFWDETSKGSLFDLGVAFAYGKDLVIANPEDIEPNEGKSFVNMISYWSMLSEIKDEE